MPKSKYKLSRDFDGIAPAMFICH